MIIQIPNIKLIKQMTKEPGQITIPAGSNTAYVFTRSGYLYAVSDPNINLDEMDEDQIHEYLREEVTKSTR